jgi:hypothetical protein
METIWQTPPIILVPIFTGSVVAGHWSGFTVDRMIQVGPTGIRVYKDSLVEDTSLWVTADTPVQESGSNDCAVWMCCGFTAYLKAAYEKTLLAHGTVGVAGHVAAKKEATQWPM